MNVSLKVILVYVKHNLLINIERETDDKIGNLNEKIWHEMLISNFSENNKASAFYKSHIQSALVYSKSDN